MIRPAGRRVYRDMTTHFDPTRLDDGWLLDAASGAAPRAVRVLAACHGAINPQAGAALSAAESAFGALLEGAPKAPVSSATYDALLARLDEDEPDEEDAPVQEVPVEEAPPDSTGDGFAAFTMVR